ncbi:hypothetical protein GALL_534040 [mine drainage metagenome]|uniref:Uncharacterized protein n=1 Tax=mine drainage metagenome TaxID=410659 RepID=A0A1J5P306_9ZZZZ
MGIVMIFNYFEQQQMFFSLIIYQAEQQPVAYVEPGTVKPGAAHFTYISALEIALL